jgi:hypothetical protein
MSSVAAEIVNYYYYYYYLFILTENGVLPCSSSTTIRHNTQIRTSHKTAHHAQMKHSPQSYTNDKGYITHMNTMQRK